jgi:hypothetical protein
MVREVVEDDPRRRRRRGRRARGLSDTATEGMDALNPNKRLSVWLWIDYHQMVCDLAPGVYHRYMDIGGTKPACFR